MDGGFQIPAEDRDILLIRNTIIVEIGSIIL